MGLRCLGDYELLEEVGRGGMGVVFKARQLSLNRIVALKIVSAGALTSEAELARFHREAETAASLNHPNIVPVYEVGEQDGYHYFSMRFLEGGSLAGETRHSAATEPKAAVLWVVKIARALQFAHEHGILHRDLKPGNILLDKTGQPHVSDFGLARRLDTEHSLTLSGAILGTPSYMAPEQAAGNQILTTASDIYGLGAVLYQLLSGRPVFENGTPMEMLAKVQHEPPVPLDRLNPNVDSDLQTICLKCLEKHPERRYGTATALAEDLERWLAGEPIRARPVSAAAKGYRWCRRKPLIAALTTVICLLALALLIGLPVALVRISREHGLSQRQGYASDMLVASYAIREGLLGRARELLQRYKLPIEESNPRGAEWHFLQVLTHGGNHAMLWENPQPIEYCAWAETNGWFVRDASGSNHWATSNHQDLNRASPFPPSRRTRLSPSGRYLVLQDYSPAGRIHVWDVARSEELFTVRPTAMQTWLRGERVAFSPDEELLYVGENKGEISIWSLTHKTEVGRFPAYPRDLKGVAPSVNGDWLAPIGGVAVSPDGDRLAVSDGLQPRLALWNTKTYTKLQETSFDNLTPAYTIRFSPDGQTLTTAHLEGELAVGKVNDLRLWNVLRPAGEFCHALGFSPDGRWLAAEDGLVARIWSTDNWVAQAPLAGHFARITALAFLTDESLATASEDGTIRHWAMPPPKESMTTIVPIPFAEVTRLSRSGRMLLTVDFAQDTVRVWSLSSPKLQAELHQDLSNAACGAVTDDGSLIAIGHDDGSISLSRAPFASTQVQPGHATNLIELACSGAGTLLASAAYDDTLRLHQVTGTRLILQSQTDFDFQHGSKLVFSPTDQLLAAVNFAKGILEVFRVPDLKRLWHQDLPSARNGDLTFSPDGGWLSAGNSRGTLRVWETERFEPVASLNPYNLSIEALAFSPDGQRLIAQLNRSRCLLWDTAIWSQVGDFDLPRAAHRLGFTADGKALVLTDLHRIIVWPTQNSL